MRINKTILILLLLCILVASCTKRKDPVHIVVDDPPLVLLSQIQTPGWAKDVWISGDKAFVADAEQGVSVYDISNPSSPELIDTLKTTGPALQVRYDPQTDLILVVEDTQRGGIPYFTLEDKIQREIIWDSGVRGFQIVPIAEDTLFVGEVDVLQGEGLRLIKMYFDPNEGNGEWVHNDIIGKFELFGGSGGGLWLEEDFAYFCINQLGIVICGFGYDGPFNNPINPYLIGKVDTPGAARDIKLNEAGTIAVIADYQAGITLIDISEKSNPKVISSFLPAGVDQVEKIFVVNNQAYFIDTNNGLFVADISDPELPFLSGRYDTPDPENLFVTSDEIIFLADQDLGLIVLEWR